MSAGHRKHQLILAAGLGAVEGVIVILHLYGKQEGVCAALEDPPFIHLMTELPETLKICLWQGCGSAQPHSTVREL